MVYAPVAQLDRATAF